MWWQVSLNKWIPGTHTWALRGDWRNRYSNLLNEDDMFECNLCTFKSGNSGCIREHLVEHVIIPKVPKKVRNESEKNKVLLRWL